MPRRLRGDAELGIGSKSTPWYSCYRRYHHRLGRVIAKFTERSVNRHYPPLENYSEIVRSRERNSIRNSPFVDTFIFNGSYSRRTSSRSKKHRDCPFDQIVQLSSTLSSLQIRKISLNTNLSSKFYIRHLPPCRRNSGKEPYSGRGGSRRIEFGAASSCGTGNKQSGG